MKFRYLIGFSFLLTAAIHGVCHAQGQLWGTTRKGGATGGGVIFKTNADASSYYETKKQWALNTPGAFPQASLIQASDGRIYGVTPSGGAYGDGVLFAASPSGFYQVMWHFWENYEGGRPLGGLVEAANGKIYGLTSRGGPNYNGTLFEYDPVSQLLSHKIHLTALTGSMSFGSMLAASNGKLYGTCRDGGSAGYGVLFEYDPTSNVFAVKHHFDNATGAAPYGSLTQAVNGKLYGTTSQGGADGSGVLFEYDFSTESFIKLYDFVSSTGKLPSGALVQASNGKLYGMCPGGGANDGGVIFEYDLALSQYTLMRSFIHGDVMGSRPFGGLTEASNGKLYGLTARLGADHVSISVIIEFDPATGTSGHKLGASFSNGAGDYNYSSMFRSGNSLYGVSPKGGETGSGVLFSYSPLIDTYYKVLDFDYGEDGALPYAGMTLAGNGKMYGLLSTGGSGKKGLLYEFDPVTEAYAKKVEFTGSNGANPLGEMLLASNGKLYGTTTFGGSSSITSYFPIEDGSFTLRQGTGPGVIFEYDPATGTYTKKADFNMSIGINPYGQLMEAGDGFFYGVTNRGGANNGGTIYKFDAGTNQLTKLKDLPANANFLVPGPRSGLTEASNGKFYGVTPYGDNATDGGGIVYEYDPSTDDLTILKKFPAVYSAVPNDGNVPMGKLTLGADGKLYGMNSQGGEQTFLGGSIFQVDPATGQVTTKKYFSPSVGVFPKGSLVSDASGKMYALCNKGNFGRWGTIIQYDPVSNSLIQKAAFFSSMADSPDYSSLALYPGKMEQHIELEPGALTVSYGTPVWLRANSSAGLPITYIVSDPSVATVSGTEVTPVSIGSTEIKATQPGNADYDAAPDVIKTLTVTKGNQRLLFGAFTEHKVSEGSVSLYAYVSTEAFVSTGLAPVFTSSDPEIASVNGNVLTLHKIGTVTITASQPGNEFYHAAPSVDQSLTIIKGDQAISFPEFETVRVDAAPFKITASVSSGLPLTFTSSNTDVATVSGDEITVISGGSTNITAVQGGNENYNAAADVTRILVVSKLDQTIDFPAIDDRTVGDAPFALSAFSSAGLSVQYSTASDKVIVATDEVTIVKAGLVTIAADQEGNGTYGAAPRVEQSFCINPAKPIITLSVADNENKVLASSAPDGNQWYLNGQAIASATGATWHPETAGVYTVKATVDDCVSELSDPFFFIVTDILSTSESTIKIYPNPAVNQVTIELPGRSHSCEVQLLTPHGSLLQTLQTTQHVIEWNVQGLRPGVYIMRVKDGSMSTCHKLAITNP